MTATLLVVNREQIFKLTELNETVSFHKIETGMTTHQPANCEYSLTSPMCGESS